MVAHVGETITILGGQVSSSGSGSGCAVTNGQGWIVYPNNTVQKAIQDFSLQSGAAGGGNCLCPGTCSPGGISTCLPFTQTYVVNVADINRHLSFTTNNGSIGNNCDVPGREQEVQFAFNVVGNNLPSGAATACPKQSVLILLPCISITKECITDCPPTNSAAYGSPIRFRGVVSNNSDTNTTLFNIQVSDSVPGASITFSNLTSLGHTFNGGVSNINNHLLPGESVSYTGTFTPTGNLCGPFSDTISVTAQDITGFAVNNTDPCIDPVTLQSSGPRAPVTATCTVCTAPCIAVTKICSTNLVFLCNSNPGSIGFSGIVSNCGTVPLTNVVLTDDLTGSTVLSLGSLAIGATAPWSATFTVNPSLCGRSNIVNTV